MSISGAAFAEEERAWTPPASSQASAVTITPLKVDDDWFQRVITAVNQLRGLRSNWDGYQSPPIQDAAFQSVALVLRAVRREALTMPHIAPVTGGGISLEWHAQHRQLELEILPDGTVEYLCVEKTTRGSEVVDEGQLTIARLYEAQYLVDWFLERR